MTDSRPPASTEPAQTMPAGVSAPAEPLRADSGPRMAADAYRHAVLERMALYAQTGTVPGDPLPEVADIAVWPASTARPLVEQALHLCQNGERAPGGDETWAGWVRDAEAWVRSQWPGTAAVTACTVDESGGVDPDREAAERAAAKRIGMALTNASAVAGERAVIADWLRRRAFDGELGAETVAVLNAAADRIEKGAV